MKTWESLYRILQRINLTLGVIAGIIVVVASIITSYDVLMRYGFDAPTTWAGELACYLMVYVVFLGLALALQNGAHVSVEMFLELANERTQWVLRLLGGTIVAVFGGILTWQTAVVAFDSFRYNWISSSMMAMPLKYVYLVGPVGSFLFTFTSILLLVKIFVNRPGKGPS